MKTIIELATKLETLDPKTEYNEVKKIINTMRVELKKIYDLAHRSKVIKRPEPKTHLLHGYGGHRIACSTLIRNAKLTTTEVEKTTCPSCLKGYKRNDWMLRDHLIMLEWAKESEQPHIPAVVK